MAKFKISGSFHQGQLQSNSAGFQCTAMAYMSLIALFMNQSHWSQWNPQTVDRILRNGHSLYNDIIEASSNPQARYLGHWELPSAIEIQNNVIQNDIYTDIFFGVVGQSGTLNVGSLALNEAVRNAATVSDFMIVTFDAVTISLAHNSVDDLWYIFDSHSTNRLGANSPFGTAGFFIFQTLDELLQYLFDKYINRQFNISPIIFQSTTDFDLQWGEQIDFDRLYNSHLKQYCMSNPTIDHCYTTTNLTEATSESTSQRTKELPVLQPESSETVTARKLAKIVPNTTNDYVYIKVNTTKSLLESIQRETLQSNKTGLLHPVSESNKSENESSKNLSKKTFRKKVRQIENSHLNVKKQHVDHCYCKTRFSHEENNFLNNSNILRNTCAEFIDLSFLRRSARNYELDIRCRVTNVCHCCEKFLFSDQVYTTTSFTKDIGLQLPSENLTLCSSCCAQIGKGTVPSTSITNNLKTVDVPDCLKELTIVEKRLISQLQSFMTLLVLPGGQFAEKGLAIHFPLKLNLYLSNLKDVQYQKLIIVNQTNQQQSFQAVSLQSIANMNAVIDAIKWLKINNHLYKEYPSFNKSAISSENLTNEISYLKEMVDDLPQSATINSNYSMPNVTVDNITKNNVLNLPVQYDKPVWINDIPNGEELAFPWLFPDGVNGVYTKRNTILTTLKYFQSKLYNQDSRWRKNITYLMYAVNHYEQKSLLSTVGIHMRKKKPGHTPSITNANISSLENLAEIQKNSYMFMKNIRGTAAYWSEVLYKLLAMVKSLGSPTIFLTLSADDNHWPELAMLFKDTTYEEAVNFKSCASELKQDPLLASIHFERRWNALFKHVLNGNDKPLGNIVDYFGRVEYQNRGSPHLHLFLWIENAPSIIHSTSKEIEHYIDSIVSTTIPDNDIHLKKLVERLQIHHHTPSCQKRGSCRFAFPRRECKDTKILSNVNVTSTHNKGRFYETKRTHADRLVNAYNPEILRRWRANMDIQMVNSATSLAYYVCTYIAKSEPDDLKYALSEIISKIANANEPVSVRTQLLQIGNCVLKHRRLSAQEACARIANLKLVWSSRAVIYLNTRPDNERYRVLKSFEERSQLTDNSTDIFQTNIIDYYQYRPDHLNNKSLFYFASWYKMSYQRKQSNSNSTIVIKMKNKNVTLQKRTKALIIRTPKFTPHSEGYYFSLLMLHYPFRCEADIILPYSNAKEAFLHKHSTFNIMDIQYESFLGDIEQTVQYIRSANIDVGSVIAPNTMEDVTPDEEYSIAHEFSIPSSESTLTDVDIISNNNTVINSSIVHTYQVNSMANKTLLSQISQFNSEQRQLFEDVKQHYEQNTTSPLRLFISGGAGTGKSFLLRSLVGWLQMYTTKCSGCNPVLVCGPTGMSAKNIGGKTLHSALRLPVQHGKEPSYKELSSKVLNILRPIFKNIHTLIIDEISMVSSVMFTFIHRRLVSLTKNEDFFGGLNIILMGDFFQLKPVRGHFAFTNHILWNLFKPVILKENMRQKGDSLYKELLNRARIGKLETQDIDMLKTRLLENDVNFDGVLRVYPKCSMVDKYNIDAQSTLSQTLVSIVATHSFSNTNIHTRIQNVENFIPSDDRDAGGLPRNLHISIGTRVILIRNIATEQGLVNGALGVVHDINFGLSKVPSSIYIKFDDQCIGRLFYSEEYDAIEITRITQEFCYQGHSICRTQFPLLPAWACTIHKVQGCTLNKVVADIGSNVFEAGQSYVALSRVTSLSGLLLLSLDPAKIRANPKVVEFYENCSQL